MRPHSFHTHAQIPTRISYEIKKFLSKILGQTHLNSEGIRVETSVIIGADELEFSLQQQTRGESSIVGLFFYLNGWPVAEAVEQAGVLASRLVTLHQHAHLRGFHGDAKLEGSTCRPHDALTVVEVETTAVDRENETLVEDKHRGRAHHAPHLG